MNRWLEYKCFYMYHVHVCFLSLQFKTPTDEVNVPTMSVKDVCSMRYSLLCTQSDVASGMCTRKGACMKLYSPFACLLVLRATKVHTDNKVLINTKSAYIVVLMCM